MFKVCWCGTGIYYEFCWNLVLYPVVKELVKSIIRILTKFCSKFHWCSFIWAAVFHLEMAKNQNPAKMNRNRTQVLPSRAKRTRK